jgi:hypothetical protein
VGGVAAGQRVTATFTDTAGNTSEFGANRFVAANRLLVNDTGDAADATPGDGACAAVSYLLRTVCAAAVRPAHVAALLAAVITPPPHALQPPFSALRRNIGARSGCREPDIPYQKMHFKYQRRRVR